MAQEPRPAGGGQPDEGSDTPRQYDISKRAELIELIGNEKESVVKPHLVAQVDEILRRHGLADKYTTLLLYDDEDLISAYHANRLYRAASNAKAACDILLIVHSRGGEIEPAYLISKTCKKLAKKRFVAAVPRRAKSAATLLSLGGTEIHMGLMSELGPIDPQIGGYPSLALENSLDVVAELAARFPQSGEMFARYLVEKLDLQTLGYFKRVGESAVQYAERLLDGRTFPKGRSPHDVADQLVNHYKDHGFVIDVDEARLLLGDMIKTDTAEYHASNEIYEFLDFSSFVYNMAHQSTLEFVGAVEQGPTIRKKAKAD